MEFEVSGYGIPGYNVGLVIFNQRNLILRTIWGTKLPTDIKRFHIRKSLFYFVGPKVATRLEFDKPNGKTTYGPFAKNLKWELGEMSKKEEAKALRMAAKLCQHHNIWASRTPKSTIADIRNQKLIWFDTHSRIRLVANDADQSSTERQALQCYKDLGRPCPPEAPRYKCEAVVESRPLEMHTVYPDAFMVKPIEESLYEDIPWIKTRADEATGWREGDPGCKVHQDKPRKLCKNCVPF